MANSIALTLLFNVGMVEQIQQEQLDKVETVDEIINGGVAKMITEEITHKLKEDMSRIIKNLDFPNFLIVDIVFADAEKITNEVEGS